MKLPRRNFLHLAAGAAALPALSRFAWPQAYPIRPITIVDTFPSGGSTGIVARIIADKFSETLGQQVIVDQRAGAGGTVAAKQIARSTPDGYTIMLGFTGTLGIAPSLLTPLTAAAFGFSVVPSFASGPPSSVPIIGG